KAGAGDLDQAERLQLGNELLDLGLLAGDLEDEMRRRGVERLGVELFGNRLRLGVLVALAGNLDHGELALKRVPNHRQVGDAMDRYQLFELMLNLLDHGRWP